MKLHQLMVIAFALFSSSAAPYEGSGKTVTFSFDDAPRGDGYFSGQVRTSKFIEVLSTNRVNEVAFYANSKQKGVPEKEISDRLMRYARAGHVIANHTARHQDCEKLSAQEYIKSIQEADSELRIYPTFQPWFRYPYLRECLNDAIKHAEVKKFLETTGYRQGYVTVEIYDYLIDQRMNEAMRDGKVVDFEKLKTVYLKVFSETMDFYEQLAQRSLKYSPIHVLLMHENDLNVLFLKDIIQWLRTNGYEIVDARKAFDDPILSDKKWDVFPRSMRRLRLAAEKSGYSGPTVGKWVGEKPVDQLLQDSGLFRTKH